MQFWCLVNFSSWKWHHLQMTFDISIFLFFPRSISLFMFLIFYFLIFQNEIKKSNKMSLQQKKIYCWMCQRQSEKVPIADTRKKNSNKRKKKVRLKRKFQLLSIGLKIGIVCTWKHIASSHIDSPQNEKNASSLFLRLFYVFSPFFSALPWLL